MLGGLKLTLVLLEGLGELVDRRGNLQTLHQDSLLPLDANVAGPFDEAGEVALRLDVSSKTEVASVLLEKRSGASGATSTSLGFNDLLSLLNFLSLIKQIESLE